MPSGVSEIRNIRQTYGILESNQYCHRNDVSKALVHQMTVFGDTIVILQWRDHLRYNRLFSIATESVSVLGSEWH